MSIFRLPNELLIQIVDFFDHEADINSIARCNRRLYDLFNTYLYTHNIKQNSSHALLWASSHGRLATLPRLLKLGADIHTKTPPTYRYDFCDGTWNTSLNGLYLACLNGHPNIARLLLEAGINDSEYARGRESMPLYYALRQGHDAVALVLLEHFTDVKGVLSWTSSMSTALLLVSYLGLPELVRVCLKRGADVGTEDAEGMTALHYALLGGGREVCRECAERAFFGMRKEIVFESKGEGWGADVETVRLLLEAGADLDARRVIRGWRHRHTARELARRHPDTEMRRECGIEGGWLGGFVRRR